MPQSDRNRKSGQDSGRGSPAQVFFTMDRRELIVGGDQKFTFHDANTLAVTPPPSSGDWHSTQTRRFHRRRQIDGAGRGHRLTLLCAQLEMKPIDLHHCLAKCESPALGPGPRSTVTPLSELTGQLNDSLSTAGIAGTQAGLLRATILLWHDHHESAHGIVQEIETQDGSYLHAILHRREPDYFNAKYWFRRVGQHSCYRALAAQASEILQRRGEGALAKKLLPRGEWDAMAFVDACEAAASASAPSHDILREIQQAEFEILLSHLCNISLP